MDLQILKQQHDIVDLIGRTVSLKQHNQRYAGLISFHKDTVPSLVIYPNQKEIRFDLSVPIKTS